MFQEWLLLIVGIFILLSGAEFLIRGAVEIAVALGVSIFVVGLTVVAFGTSAPELFVSLAAASKGSADVAVGNVIGSNIFNILVVIGLAAIIKPFRVSSEVIKREMPLMITVLGLYWLAASTGTIQRWHGVLFFIGIILYVWLNYFIAVSRTPKAVSETIEETENKPPVRVWRSIVLIIIGLACMALGSDFIVDSAIAIARDLGVSEMVIAVTIVAVGTSLPEIATTVIAAKKGEPELVVGNAIGSNIFNVLCVIGISSMAQPLNVDPGALKFDFPFMFYSCAAVLPLMIFQRNLNRGEGILMITAYFAYLYLVFTQMGATGV